MDEMEHLRTELSALQKRVETAELRLQEYVQRLTLSDEERDVLAGREDGCIRIGELRPIVRRVFGDAA